MSRNTAGDYIRANFEPQDLLAVVLLNKRTDTVIQRLAAAERIAELDFQAWLRRQNDRQFEVYVSMNALREGARGRTKADVAAIRHVYLDFDDNGTPAVEELLKRQDLPKPNYLVSSSPDKWQVVWKVEGFSKDEAERLQKGLARQTGADIAATDCARVLRLPGYNNHKYSTPHLIRTESLATETYRHDQFPKFPAEERAQIIGPRANGDRQIPKRDRGAISQSERDWAYAKRALARGEAPELVIAAIASYRRYDKGNPRYYAELTVQKASASLDSTRDEPRPGLAEPERT